MRKLASIQRISNIRPIPGADKIEVADVLGWSVVVGKGEFQVGDLAVYFEIDSFLSADNPAFASFEDRFITWNGKRGMRLKTIRLRKQISQGLLMPIGKFPVLGPPVRNGVEGEDVTDLLKIEKWEPAEEASSNSGGGSSMPFPHFIFKTDQERVQNMMGRLPSLVDHTFEVSIKLDGSSMTVYHLSNTSPEFAGWYGRRAKREKRSLWQKFLYWAGFKQEPTFMQGVCSRNVELDKDGNSNFAATARKLGIFEALENYGRNIALQGELIGPSIQQNHEQVKDYEFHVFSVFNIDKGERLLPEEARLVVDVLGLSYTPVLEKFKSLGDFITDMDNVREAVDNILNYAEGSGMNPGVKREGLVFKSNTDPEVSFKAISNSYLLKKEGK